MFEIKLKAVAVSKKLKEYKEIKSLMCRAFPKNEQIPMWLLHILAIRKSVEFSAYYDEDLFCGISYTVSNEELLFILYLAVNDKIRSKGYGSAILQCIKQRFSSKAIAFQDNRAFCKYICPITIFLKPMSYFALFRIKCDKSKCVSCGKCKKACPMDVDVTDNSRRRKNGTECILCMECVKSCPKDAL